MFLLMTRRRRSLPASGAKVSPVRLRAGSAPIKRTEKRLTRRLGLPTETAEDVDEIVRLVGKIRTVGKEATGKLPGLRVSAATFVPKPHTPFQWVAQEDEAQLNKKQEFLGSPILK